MRKSRHIAGRRPKQPAPIDPVNHYIKLGVTKGVRPELLYATDETGMFLTRWNEDAWSASDLAEWDDAIAEFQAMRQGLKPGLVVIEDYAVAFDGKRGANAELRDCEENGFVPYTRYVAHNGLVFDRFHGPDTKPSDDLDDWNSETPADRECDALAKLCAARLAQYRDMSVEDYAERIKQLFIALHRNGIP